MNLSLIKKQIDPILEQQITLYQRLIHSNSYSWREEQGFLAKSSQIIASRLEFILSNINLYPIFTEEEAENFYFGINGYSNFVKRYNDIMELQDYIIAKTDTPFTYDNYLLLKLLQITQKTYNRFYDTALNNPSNYDQKCCDLLLDLDAKIMSQRNMSAENGIKNARAVDNINRYQRSSGGYGIISETNSNIRNDKILIVYSPEDTQKMLHNNFNFAKRLQNKDKKGEKQEND